MEKTVLPVGTLLKVLPKTDLKSGKVSYPGTEFVLVVGRSPKGLPIVKPLGNEDPLYNKIMHWSKTGWRVYGHDTIIYTKETPNYINH